MLLQKNPEDSSSAIPRVPPAHDELQVNYCKNPNCDNFGVAIPETAQRGAGATNSYIIGAGGKGMPTAKCNACGEHFPLKSNLGIAEEFQRMTAWLAPLVEPIHCPNETCANHAGQVLVGTGRLRLLRKDCHRQPALALQHLPEDVLGQHQAYGETAAAQEESPDLQTAGEQVPADPDC